MFIPKNLANYFTVKLLIGLGKVYNYFGVPQTPIEKSPLEKIMSPQKNFLKTCFFYLMVCTLMFDTKNYLFRFCNGEKRGPQWRWGRGGSYNVGNVDIDNKPG